MDALLKGPAEKPRKPPPDPEFLAHAAATKNDENAEWRYDTSDAESSSDSSSNSDSESDSDDDEEVTAMKPEDIAKVLMQEEEDGPSTGAGPLRTKNEVPEEAEKVERPGIVVTPEVKIEELGTVESTLEHLVLIKASTSGEFQVLCEGSLLVLDDRTVIGTVADTLGRVEEPLYTVRFNSLEEIQELKVEVGKKIFYVPEHSTYVFTKPLLAQKGSDASNLYDEEAGE
ncbi:Gar1/Naf1 RNA binding region-domain-containing protein, partial [Sphaerosporella brunnea]